eukprot:6184634-Pleurochrysis_carterae.AAC.1
MAESCPCDRARGGASMMPFAVYAHTRASKASRRTLGQALPSQEEGQSGRSTSFTKDSGVAEERERRERKKLAGDRAGGHMKMRSSHRR